MRSALLALPLALLSACGGSSEGPGTTTTTTMAPAKPVATSPRAPDAAQRSAMVNVLKGETGADKRVSFIVSPGSAETVALASALEAVFREGGWASKTQPLTGMVLKPGPVRILVGEEQEPPQVDTVRKALEAGGLTVETGTGYRAFYEEKKKENPNWPGIPMTAEQAFIVVLAPQPPATPPAS
jgi:hypothetical protein